MTQRTLGLLVGGRARSSLPHPSVAPSPRNFFLFPCSMTTQLRFSQGRRKVAWALLVGETLDLRRNMTLGTPASVSVSGTEADPGTGLGQTVRALQPKILWIFGKLDSLQARSSGILGSRVPVATTAKSRTTLLQAPACPSHGPPPPAQCVPPGQRGHRPAVQTQSCGSTGPDLGRRGGAGLRGGNERSVWFGKHPLTPVRPTRASAAGKG
jgi:hypothetical protein